MSGFQTGSGRPLAAASARSLGLVAELLAAAEDGEEGVQRAARLAAEGPSARWALVTERVGPSLFITAWAPPAFATEASTVVVDMRREE